jgi:hypothetical protein
MKGNADGSVVVVGAGIVGCSIAVHLLDRGLRPILIDPDRPGQGASAGSFASVSAFGKDPAAYFQLAVAGVAGRRGPRGRPRPAGRDRAPAGPDRQGRLPSRRPGAAGPPAPAGRRQGAGRGAHPGDGGHRPGQAPGLGAADGLLAPFRPGRFAERTTRIMLEVESVFREPTRQDHPT